MDPVTLAALKGLMEELLAPVIVKVVMQVLRKHTADPEFGKRADAWLADAALKEGGTLEELAQVSADLRKLMGS
jgi:hypothetical protein